MKKEKNSDSHLENDIKKNKIKFGTNAMIIIAALIAVFVFANLILEMIPLNLDFTEEKLFTLTDTTKKIISDTEEDIEIYALYDRLGAENDTSLSNVVKILDLFDSYDNISVEYVDINKKPAFLLNTVGQANYTDYSEGDYIVKCGKSSRRIEKDDMYTVTEQTYQYFFTRKIITGVQVENKVCDAIIRLTSEVPAIYWSVDFGEPNLGSPYYSTFVKNIEDMHYDVSEIKLMSEEIPKNAAAIMFVAPTEDLTDPVIDKLNYYFEHGGNAMFFMDVKTVDDSWIYNDFSNFNEVFGKYGLRINNDIVSENDKYRIETDNSDEAFRITTATAGALENLPRTEIKVMNTRSVSLLDNAGEYCDANAFMTTSSGAVSKSLKDEKTVTGKAIVAASCRYTASFGEPNIVIFGSSANIQNAFVQFFGNEATGIIKSSLSWMDNSENLSDEIETKSYNKVTKSIVEVTELQQKGIAIALAVFALLILAAGIVVWFIRRRL